MNDIIIFTDGAARNNPGAGGWGAIVITPDRQVVEVGGADGHTTNNKMEMTAAIEGLIQVCEVPGKVSIYTDSSYLVRGITEWIRGWRRKGWLTREGQPVLNRELWQRLEALVAARGKDGAISWNHVRGHAGVPGNERCDAIATAVADRKQIELYCGPLADYEVDIEDLKGSGVRPSRNGGGSSKSSGKSSSRPAYSYLSLVGDKLERHSTWAECERRVKGVSGAKFKKATSAADEIEICRGWGCSVF